MTIRVSSLAVATLMFALSATPVVAQEHQHGAHGNEDVGRVTFPTSCNPAIQPDLERAVAMLHSFWYEEAEESFSEVAGRRPRVRHRALGRGNEPLQTALAAALPAEVQRAPRRSPGRRRRCTPTRARRPTWARSRPSTRTRAATPHAARAAAYEKAMAALHAAHPKDDEAAAFYALALLGTAAVSPTDPTYERQKKAAAAPQRASRPAHPKHPGHRALPDPRLRLPGARAAGAAGGAQLREDRARRRRTRCTCRRTSSRASGCGTTAIASNIASAETARAYATQSDACRAPGIRGAARARLPRCTRYLQGAQDDKARERCSSGCAAITRRSTPPEFAAAYALGAVPARYALERRDWARRRRSTLPATRLRLGQVSATSEAMHLLRVGRWARRATGDICRAAGGGGDASRRCTRKLRGQGQVRWTSRSRAQRRAAAAMDRPGRRPHGRSGDAPTRGRRPRGRPWRSTRSRPARCCRRASYSAICCWCSRSRPMP